MRSSAQSMIPLATVNKEMKIQLHEEAMNIIQNFMDSQLTFITFAGFKEYQSPISQSVMKSQVSPQSQESCLWMRSKPIYNQKTQKHLFFLQCQSWEPKEKQLLHLISSSISYVSIIAIREYDDISYLAAASERTVERKDVISHQNKYKMAQLVCIMPSFQEQSDYLTERTQIFLKLLQQRGIQSQVLSGYPLVKCYNIHEQLFNNASSKQIQNQILQQISTACVSSRENSQLMYGPIISQFLLQIRDQLNYKNGMLNLQTAEQDIQIQPAYEAYMQGVQKYHQYAMAKLSGNQREDINQINEHLLQSKQEAHNEYFECNGASNLKYKRLLDNYIGHKEEEIRNMCFETHNNKNLQILQAQSKLIVEKLENDKSKASDHAYVTGQLENMTKTYEQEAKGPNKHQILSDYMKVFCPMVYGINKGKEAQLRKQEQKNKQLNDQLAKLKEKQGKCCVVM